MANLTDGKAGTIAKAEAPAKGQRFVFDDHRDAPRGLALRVTAAGGRAFVLRYVVDGRQRLFTIGAWPTWTLAAARAEAHDLLRRVAAGDDPLEAKRSRKEEWTIAKLADEWLDKHAVGLKSEADIRGVINGTIVPALGRVKLSDLRRRAVIEVIETKAATAPRAAALALTYCRKMLDYAADRDLLPANPLAGLKPSSITVAGKRDPLKPVVRERVLDTDEARAFWDNAETCGLHRLTALCLKLILVTGQRPGECAGLHESEISGRIWTIPAARRGKTDTEHSVFLTDTALDVIAAARTELARLGERRKTEPTGHIFEAKPGAPITNAALGRAVARFSDELGSHDRARGGRWRPHDLRRTMRTGLSACRVRPDIAELVIGHTKKGIIATYDQHAFDMERQAALEAWERRLQLILAGHDPDAESADNVVKLEAVR